MARPSTHDDVPPHRMTRDLATFHLDQFSGDPTLVSAYADFVSVAKRRHNAPVPLDGGGHVTIARPLSDTEKDKELATAQAAWDSTEKRYNAVERAVADGTMAELAPKWQDYEAYTLRNHAERENYLVFDLIAEDDAVRKAARENAGIS